MEKDVFNIVQQISQCDRQNILEARRLNIEEGFCESSALLEAKCGSKTQVLKAMSLSYGFPSLIDLSDIAFNNVDINKVGADNILSLKFIPYFNNNSLKVLIVDPKYTVNIEDEIKRVYGDISYKFVIIMGIDFDNWLRSMGIDEESTRLNTMLSDITVAEQTQEEDIANSSNYDQTSIVNVVNRFIVDAVSKKASDIHIEPLEKVLRVRFRIDGLLTTQAEIDRGIHRQLANRIKVMSNLNTTNTMTPQSGKLHMIYKGKPIDARVSTIPGLYGETVTLRLISNESMKTRLEELGFNDTTCKKLRHLMTMPNGLILVTGPTGSGKSSTLAAMINELNTIDRCIITIEDPVEFRINGVTQINVNNAVNLTFASTLREALRQDPDIIMVGEIRDTETAKIAISASNTGHLVLSTLHTNSASSSAVRLTEMGVEPFMVAATIRGIINQKLVRVLCPHCREKVELKEGESAWDYIPDHIKKTENHVGVYKAVGCSKCNGTGYRGRTVILELLEFTQAMSKLILSGANSDEIEEFAMDRGMTRAIDNGIQLVLKGITSLEEVDRVINIGI